MPLRCVDDRGKAIEANACTEQEWAALKAQTRVQRHLTMPCCKAQAVPKTSKLGTRFFAHKARAGCLWKPETEAHRRLKALALQAARRAGWNAQTEVSGYTPDGERWTADMLAQKGADRIAIEVQWSGQTDEETLRRQRKYRQSGVTGIWLLRQPGFPVSQDLPAACIGGSMEEGLTVMLPIYRGMTVRNRATQEGWSQILTPEDFLRAIFEGRFHFGIPSHAKAILDIIASTDDCRRCGKNIRVVTMLRGNAGPYKIEQYGDRGPQELAREYSTIKKRIVRALAHRTDVGQTRFSQGVIHTYVSCRCPECGVWTRGIREIELWGWNEDVLGAIELGLADCWRAFVAEGDLRWAVWAAQDSSSPA